MFPARAGDSWHIRLRTHGRRGNVHLEAPIPVGVEASGLARDQVDGWLSASLGEEIAERARLATSEIVTNAVRHGALDRDEALRLSVDVDPTAVRVTVEQSSEAAGAALVPPEKRGPN